MTDLIERGCEHYKRKCQLVAPCCDKVYTCRFCHDETEQHTLNRSNVNQVVCSVCHTKQPVQQKCSDCGILFGRYFCGKCKLIDDDDDKKQYHCEGCCICRVGGRENFFHCQKCDMCLHKRVENKHRCVEKMSRTNCPICMEDIHTSTIPAHIPACGHPIHLTCFEELARNGHYACPVCQTSMVNMELVWQNLDREIAATPMPAEYRDHMVSILCRDCHKFSQVAMHVLGAKCSSCGSYNTCR